MALSMLVTLCWTYMLCLQDSGDMLRSSEQ